MLKAQFSPVRINHHQQYVLLDISLSIENEIFPVVWKQSRFHTAWNLLNDEDSRAYAALCFPVAAVRRIKSRKGTGKKWLDE